MELVILFGMLIIQYIALFTQVFLGITLQNKYYRIDRVLSFPVEVTYLLSGDRTNCEIVKSTIYFDSL